MTFLSNKIPSGNGNGYTGYTGYTGPSGGGSPAGSDTEIQFNDSGSFGASPGLTYYSVGHLKLAAADSSNYFYIGGPEGDSAIVGGSNPGGEMFTIMANPESASSLELVNPHFSPSQNQNNKFMQFNYSALTSDEGLEFGVSYTLPAENGTLALLGSDGFMHIPYRSGPPVSNPDTGEPAMVFDVLNNKLCIFNGSEWTAATFTVI